MKTESWSQRGLVVTFTDRGSDLPPLLSATLQSRSTTSYSVAAIKDWLLGQGMDPGEPVLEWLWALQERGHE